MIPKTHLKRRHSLPDEMKAQKSAIPIECLPGSLVMLGGSVWHSNYPREIEGKRVVLHITFNRLALRTIDSYDHLDEEWLKGKPKELSTMLGREGYFGHNDPKGAGASQDIEGLKRAFKWGRG